MMRCKRTGEIESALTNTHKKNLTCYALVVACKKNTQLFTTFSRHLYFADFFQVWKIAGQISRLFQEFKTLYETWKKSLKAWFKCCNELL